MTSKEILIKYVVCPFDKEVIADKGSYNSIFERYLSDKMREYEDEAKIESKEIYYPKIIKDLKYEVAKKAPTLYHIWAEYANLSHNFLKESKAILRWIDERLEEKDHDPTRRKRAEEQYQHELFYFYINLSLIRKLHIQLAEVENANPILVADTDDICRDRVNEIRYRDLFLALRGKGLIAGNANIFVDMCIGSTDTPSQKIQWLKKARNKHPHTKLLIELLSLIGMDMERIRFVLPEYFGLRLHNKQKSRIKQQDHSEYFFTLKDLVDPIMNRKY